MKACVFGGTAPILVIRIPIEEINIQRGLKQGDPLRPFLCLLVAEGFSGLMENAVKRNLFKRFKFFTSGIISHLQYVESMTLLCRQGKGGKYLDTKYFFQSLRDGVMF